jgi:L-cysteine:1D-myo-inositol 2-amino-2-deoxy-alpha-D-glucopyranoside ligase
MAGDPTCGGDGYRGWPMPLRLFDTARRAVVPFEPGELVTMYVCGITPYDATHLGHAATYTTFDVVRRRLEDLGHEVRLVRNITDVDDDILDAARSRDIHYLDLSNAQIRRFQHDMTALGVAPPWSEPRATGAIPDIRGLIAMLLDRGFAYESGGGVYFDVSLYPEFGSLSGSDRVEMLRIGPARGERIDDPRKHDPLDFVLWQPSEPGEPAWESPWGRGRPGWHVECSALVLRELGTTIDLHGGGDDLVYPHHECERAQSEAATGEPLARHWMHQSMVHYDGRKMSKSVGNLVFVAELCDKADPRAVRLALAAQHYRAPWEWHGGLLDTAIDRLGAWLDAGPGVAALAEVRSAIDDDLDVPGAVELIDDAAARGYGVSAAAALVGVSI